MMKAMLVGKEWFPNQEGGLNRYFYGEVCSLPAVGVSGTALVTSVRPGQTAPLELRGMARDGAPLIERWRGARREALRSFNEGVDVVNSHFALYAYPWVRSMCSRTPLVINFQGPYSEEMRAETPAASSRYRVLLARHIEHTVYRRADMVITLSQAFASLAVGTYGIPANKIRVIPGAIEPQTYLSAPGREEARDRLGWPQDRTILLAVRRLARRMGLENLIDAVNEVRRQCPDVLLLIGGKGAIHDELQQRITERGLTNHVRLLGFVADTALPLAYASADVTVVPTVSLEGFGLITAESLLCGTPVMGTPVGGTPEILTGLTTRLLFKGTDSSAIAEGLCEALCNRSALPSAEECRAYAMRYAWSEVAPTIRNTFEDAIAARTGSSAGIGSGS